MMPVSFFFPSFSFLCYVMLFISLLYVCEKLFYYYNFFFIKKYFNFFMFRDVPECFRVPGFIDARIWAKVPHEKEG